MLAKNQNDSHSPHQACALPPIVVLKQCASCGSPTSHFGQEYIGAEDLALLCKSNEPLNKSKQCNLLDQQKMQCGCCTCLIKYWLKRLPTLQLRSLVRSSMPPSFCDESPIFANVKYACFFPAKLGEGTSELPSILMREEKVGGRGEVKRRASSYGEGGVSKVVPA